MNSLRNIENTINVCQLRNFKKKKEINFKKFTNLTTLLVKQVFKNFVTLLASKINLPRYDF